MYIYIYIYIYIYACISVTVKVQHVSEVVRSHLLRVVWRPYWSKPVAQARCCLPRHCHPLATAIYSPANPRWRVYHLCSMTVCFCVVSG